MAQLLGLEVSSYCDLEQYDDELASSMPLAQATHLALLLGVTLRSLVDPDSDPGSRISIEDLPRRISDHIASEGVSVEDLEERIGWNLRQFLDAPALVAAKQPLMFLRDLATSLNINWLSLLPGNNAI